ncbi:MAG: hypothetical protein ACK40G_05355 [Cytophagaceae bacterium]
MDIRIIILLLLTLIIVFPILLSVIIYKWLKSKKYNKKIRVVSLIPIFVTAYFLYTAVYPTERFYREDFKEVTKTDLPQSAKFIYKSATLPDHFGDYSSVALIKTDSSFIKDLKINLLNLGFKYNFDKISSPELSEAMTKTGESYLIDELALEQDFGKYYYVGFFSDGESIVVNRTSW